MMAYGIHGGWQTKVVIDYYYSQVVHYYLLSGLAGIDNIEEYFNRRVSSTSHDPCYFWPPDPTLIISYFFSPFHPIHLCIVRSPTPILFFLLNKKKRENRMIQYDVAYFHPPFFILLSIILCTFILFRVNYVNFILNF
jgi:hypothetical protein